jgi:DNA-directed RNA polymerase subunit RPC12/RpoP
MSDLKEYKCPCCGGAIEFNATTQSMACPYCGTEFDIATLQSFEQELQQDGSDDMHWATTGGTGWYQGEQESLRSLTCNSCGGEVVADGTTAATECPFCGNPVMIPGQLSGALRPNLLIPFQVDKEAAKAALRNHYKGKLLLPKVFKDENHIDEIKGIYVPFWLYDTDTQASVRYKATTLRTWSDSRYDYTETCYYAVRRGGSVGFEKVPVDGSTKMEDDLMESIEPFDCTKALPFHTAYLSGFLADKYDVDSAASIERANQRIKRSTEDAFRSTVQGYTTVIPEASSVSFRNGAAHYALYPVWLLNTKWNGKTYTFAMNGQTGKLVGDLPMDKAVYNKWFSGIAAAVGAAVFALSYLLWLL